MLAFFALSTLLGVLTYFRWRAKGLAGGLRGADWMGVKILATIVLAVVFVWGTTFVLVKDALQDASPLLFNLLRMALAFIALAIVNHRQLRHISRHALFSGLIVGLFLAAGYQFQTTGLARTTPANSEPGVNGSSGFI